MQNNSVGKSVASMVLGILSLVFCWVPFLGLILSLIGLPLGVSGMRMFAPGTPGGGRGMAIAGLVTSIIGLILGLIMVIGTFALACSVPFVSTMNLY